MTLWINGEARDIAATRLDRALGELGYGDALVATALNGTFVAREARAGTDLADGDRLEIVAPLQGG